MAEPGLVMTVTKGKTGKYTAECGAIEVFGEGKTAVEAIMDLAISTKDSYELLLEHKGKLTAHTEKILAAFNF